jgi:uncharacterized protein (TIGR03545 family)
MIRKSGFLFIVVVPLVMGGWLYLSRNALVERLGESLLSRMLDTEVELSGVHLDPLEMRAGFERLRIVQAEDASLYRLVAGPAEFDLNGLQLFAKRLVISRFQVEGLGFGQPRPDFRPPPKEKKAAQPGGDGAAGDGSSGKQDDTPAKDGAPPAAGEEGWSLDLPLPSLDLDALTKELDVERITSGRKLGSLAALDKARADGSGRLDALDRRFAKADPQARLAALQGELKALDFSGKDARVLKTSLADLESILKRLEALRQETAALARDAKAEPGRVRQDWAQVDRELEADVAAAMRLVHLGGLDTSQIGELVFGKAVLDRFRWMLAQVSEVRGMMGGDSARERRAPRRTGRNISFPVTARAYPTFLIEQAGFTGTTLTAEGQPRLRYSGTLRGLSSDARAYGAPMLLNATANNEAGESWRITGQFDHRESPGLDTIAARGRGVRLDDLSLGGNYLPQSVSSPNADISLDLGMRAGELGAQLRIVARALTFRFAQPGTAGGEESTLRRNLRELFTGFDQVTLQASLSGSLSHPSLKVSSSIDETLSRGLKGLLGKRQEEAEARIRRQLSAPVEARRAELEKSLAERRGALEARVAKVEDDLAAFSRRVEAQRKEAGARLKAGAGQKGQEALEKLRRR